MPSVLIVDDHEIVRQGVRQVLETQDDWQVCGEASNGQEALRLNQELKPDAIVMDTTMPVLGGLEATSEITRADPAPNVLILTMHETQPFLGARDVFLSKTAGPVELVAAVKRLLSGPALQLPPTLT